MGGKGRPENFWWAQPNPVNPNLGRFKTGVRSTYKQTYDNYYQEYWKRNVVKKRGYQKKYRDRLKAKWGCSYLKAAKLERESKYEQR